MGARPSSFKQEEKPKVEERVWSDQQKAIFRWFRRMDGACGGTGMTEVPASSPGPGEGEMCSGCPACEVNHLVVRAKAGTGKTTTIVEGVNLAPESSILVCAFNKRIADELNSRITNGAAEAKTLHSVGYAAIRRQWRGIPVAQGSTRGDSLTDMVCPKETPKPIRRLVTLLHTKGRDMLGVVPDYKTLQDLALFFDYVPEEAWSVYSLDFIVARAQEAMSTAVEFDPTYDIGVDFADMIYLPLTWNLLAKDYEMVVVDEAQDLTLAQLTIAQRLCSGRICVVGDDRQAIYGFRGADSGSLDRLKAELSAEELPLTVTYRCAQTVVERAQRLVPNIVAAPTNPQGIVDGCDYETLLTQVAPRDFILSRLNAPLVSITLQLLQNRKRARMAGRDIGAGIQAVLKRLKCNDWTSVEVMLMRLDEWEHKNVKRYASYGLIALVDRTRDQAAMIRAFADVEDEIETVHTLKDVMRQIDYLFTDVHEDDQITCSSVHKAKGLEADHVYVLEESFYRRGPSQEEDNCLYVATTRAKSHLTLVTGVPRLTR